MFFIINAKIWGFDLLDNKKNRFFILSLLGSLFVHLLALWAITTPFEIAQKEEQDNLIVLEYPAHQQIVSQKTFNKVPPKRYTPYLSQADKTVEKETQAVLKGLFYQAGNSASEIATKNPNSKSLKNIPQKQRSAKQGRVKKGDRNLASRSEKKILQKGITVAEGGLQMEVVQGGRGGQPQLSRTMDFLPGVEAGSHTLLNTRQFIYYSYFSRMKEQLYWRWVQYFKTEGPVVAFLSKPYLKKQVFSTTLYVYLSREGEIQDIRVTKSSGAEEIDSAALHAFLSAEPFPNPPKGLIEADGFIHIQQSFHLYVTPSSVHNLFSEKN